MSSLASSSQSPLLLHSGYSYPLGELVRSPGFKHGVLMSFNADVLGQGPSLGCQTRLPNCVFNVSSQTPHRHPRSHVLHLLCPCLILAAGSIVLPASSQILDSQYWLIYWSICAVLSVYAWQNFWPRYRMHNRQLVFCSSISLNKNTSGVGNPNALRVKQVT